VTLPNETPSSDSDDDDDDTSTLRPPSNYNEETPRLLTTSADTSLTLTPFQSLPFSSDENLCNNLKELQRKHLLEQQELEREFEAQRQKLILEEEKFKNYICNSKSGDPDQPKESQRKLSMSKPTDLDEMMQNQADEEEEKDDIVAELPKSRSMRQLSDGFSKIRKEQNADDVFKNDPWFQKNLLPQHEIDLSIETTQEIDIDALLGYNADEEIHPRDEPESPVVKQIEDIVWPTTIPDLNISNKVESGLVQQQIQSKPVTNKSKNSFFKFGSSEKSSANKAKKKNQHEDLLSNKEDISESEVKKKKTITTIFQKPTWKSSKSKDKESPPNKLNDQNPVDVSHLLDDEFFIEEYPLPRIDNYPSSNEVTKTFQSDDFEVFSLTDNSFQNGLDHENNQESQEPSSNTIEQQLPMTLLSNQEKESEISLEKDEEKDFVSLEVKKFLSGQSGHLDILGVPLSMPVERDEPKPTEPSKNNQKKKSNGFSAFFSSSSSQIQSRTKGVLEIEPEQKLSSAGKGFTGLFVKRQKSSSNHHPRPVSGPPNDIAHDEPFQDHRQRSKLSNIFASKRDPRAKSLSNIDDKHEIKSTPGSLTHLQQDDEVVNERKDTFPQPFEDITNGRIKIPHDEPSQDGRQRSKLSNIFASKRGPRAKSLSNMNEKQKVKSTPGFLTPLQQDNEASKQKKDKYPQPFQDITNERVKDPPETSSKNIGPEPSSNRQMGRRSGRFRKSAGDSQGKLVKQIY